MGSNTSQEEKQSLLNDNQEIQPVFEELKLVLIGIQGAGKNTVANAILKEKVFTFWTSYKSNYVEATRKVSGTKIRLARTPGWKGELKNSNETKREIVHCVQSLYSTGPHAVLLVMNVTSVLTKSTISTLEGLLTVQLWDHTIVMFTSGEKLGHCRIEDHIRCQQLQPLIDKCGQRYFVIRKNDSNQLFETIEEHIVMKNSTSCFKLSSQAEVDDYTLLSEWRCLVERIKSKIASLSDFKEKFKNTRNDHSIQKLLESKDAEIRRLQSIVEEKEKEILDLRSRHSRSQDHVLHRRIRELEHQLNLLSNDLKREKTKNETLEKKVKEKDAEIEDLRKELHMRQEKFTEWRTHEDQYMAVHASCCRDLRQDVSVRSRRIHQMQLQVLSSRGSALHTWSHTLLQILYMLSEDELKKMKYHMLWNDEYEICRSSVEHKDRVDLADQMLKQWGEERSVLITRDLLKEIPRNDDAMIQLIQPFLKAIGKTW